MDKRNDVQERPGDFEHQTETVPQHAYEVALRRRRWIQMRRLLVLGALIVPLSVQMAEAQANQIHPRYLPLALCSSSTSTFTLSGLPVPAAAKPTLLCPVTDEFPNFAVKSLVTQLAVFYFNRTETSDKPNSKIRVSACNQRFDTPQVETCVGSDGAEKRINQKGSIRINKPALVGAWGPLTDGGATTGFGYVKIEFSGTLENPDQIVAGIFLF